MKMLVVSSPHAYTTRDLYMRVAKGLKQNGADVLEFDLIPRWKMYEQLFELAAVNKMPLPETVYANLLAYEPVLGCAVWHEVDCVVIVSPQYCPLPMVEALRKVGKKTAAVFSECPYEDSSIAPIQASAFDYVFVNDRNSVELFKSFNPNSFYLPHCYDPDIHYTNGAKREENVLFIGTMYPSRYELFKAIDWSGIQLDIYGIHWLDKRHKLHKYTRGRVTDNDLAANLYRHSAVGLSFHRQERYAGAVGTEFLIDEGEAYSAGPRTWELAACGIFQVSDYRPEIEDVFGDSVPFFKTSNELQAIVKKALDNPVWRQEKAEQQRLAVQGRDCRYTMRTMLEHVA